MRIKTLLFFTKSIYGIRWNHNLILQLTTPYLSPEMGFQEESYAPVDIVEAGINDGKSTFSSITKVFGAGTLLQLLFSPSRPKATEDPIHFAGSFGRSSLPVICQFIFFPFPSDLWGPTITIIFCIFLIQCMSYSIHREDKFGPLKSSTRTEILRQADQLSCPNLSVMYIIAFKNMGVLNTQALLLISTFICAAFLKKISSEVSLLFESNSDKFVPKASRFMSIRPTRMSLFYLSIFNYLFRHFFWTSIFCLGAIINFYEQSNDNVYLQSFLSIIFGLNFWRICRSWILYRPIVEPTLDFPSVNLISET
eukprot:GHVP01020733.1.p1 GENE.GHVP01020733.1~~GHVP01020733.1.p1  ORF type:complete len:309 (-),score=19.16 GHVP01020733.1:55-981(-)